MSMRNHFDLSAYLVVGPENTMGRPVEDIIGAAVAAGFTCVQIRSKTASARELIGLAEQAAGVIAAQGKAEKVALLMDDRLDVVLAARMQGIKIDGIHVGQSDIPTEVCRKLLGEEVIVGLSARTVDLLDYARTMDTSRIDYFGAGPFHETDTKRDCDRDENGRVITHGLEDLKALARISRIPVVVGGGVKASDLPALAKTGVDGFFVVSAVAVAPDPGQAAKELVDCWTASRRSGISIE